MGCHPHRVGQQIFARLGHDAEFSLDLLAAPESLGVEAVADARGPGRETRMLHLHPPGGSVDDALDLPIRRHREAALRLFSRLAFRVIRDSDKVISGFLYSIFPAAIRSSFARMDVPLLPPQTRLSIFSWVFIAFF